MISSEDVKARFEELKGNLVSVTGITSDSITVRMGMSFLLGLLNMCSAICFLIIVVELLFPGKPDDHEIHLWLECMILLFLLLPNAFIPKTHITFFRNVKTVKVQTGKVSEWFELNEDSLFITQPVYCGNGLTHVKLDLFLEKRHLRFLGRDWYKMVDYAFRIGHFDARVQNDIAHETCNLLRSYLGF